MLKLIIYQYSDAQTLQLYHRLGLIVTKIHSAIEFTQEDVFRGYTGDIYKICAKNSLYKNYSYIRKLGFESAKYPFSFSVRSKKTLSKICSTKISLEVNLEI